MRAIAVRKFRESPEPMDLPKPEPAAGEILVHLAAAGVNPFDWKIADGTLEGKMPHEFPLIVGVDGAGTVEGVGPGVSRFKVGDGVYGQFLHAPVGRGTYAEYVAAPESIGIAEMPRGMYSHQGAAVPTAGMTALAAMDQLGLSKGQSLLILGAAGGIGSYVIQLASYAGILPLAATRGPHRDFLIKLGAARALDSSLIAFPDDVKMAYPDGVDALLDLTNRGPEFAKNLALVRPKGAVASTIGAVTAADLAPRELRGVNVDLTPSPELLERLGKEFTQGRLRIPVEQQRALEDAPAILQLSRKGELRGKTILKI